MDRNSRAVAQEHYLQVTDAHFIEAAAATEGKPEQAAQNPAQSAAVTAGTGEKPTNATNKNRPDLPSDSSSSRYLHIDQVGDTGLEPVTSSVSCWHSSQLS